MKIKQFDIWIADLNPAIGTESGKIRPVLIIQTDLLNKYHPSSIVCPITSNVQEKSDILRVHLKKSSCGLDVDSDVLIDQIRAIDNKRLLKKIGTIPTILTANVKKNLKIIFDLE